MHAQLLVDRVHLVVFGYQAIAEVERRKSPLPLLDPVEDMRIESSSFRKAQRWAGVRAIALLCTEWEAVINPCISGYQSGSGRRSQLLTCKLCIDCLL